MSVIAVCNQKGGVGKTTLALTLGVALDALLIDLDQQGNLTFAAGGESKSGQTSWDLLHGKQPITNLIQATPNGDLIASSDRLALTDMEMRAGEERRLKERLTPLKKKYPHIIIDPPPSLGRVMAATLLASDYVVIPVQADIFSLQALTQLAKTISHAREINKHLKVLGVVLNRHNPRTILSREITEALEVLSKDLNTTPLKATIREAVAVKESQVKKMNLLDYAPSSNVAADFKEVISEIKERMKEHE